MFLQLFWALLKHVGIPAGIIIVSWNRFGDARITFFIVNVVLTVTTLPLLIWQIIKLVPNLALLRAQALFLTLLEIVIEIGSVIGFWMVFAYIFR
jgi:hypothetical protein